MSINLFCDDCNYEYVLDSVQNSTIWLKGKEYEILWFACPKCHKVHVVGIRDEKFHEMNAALEIKRLELASLLSNKNISKAEYEKALKSTERAVRKLKLYADGLFSRFPGTFTISTSENNEMDIAYRP